MIFNGFLENKKIKSNTKGEVAITITDVQIRNNIIARNIMILANKLKSSHQNILISLFIVTFSKYTSN